MKRLAGVVLLLLAVSLALLATLPFTEAGSRLLAGLVTRYSPVALDYGGGQLFGAFRLDRLALVTDAVTVELEDLQADLNPACLWRSEICLRSLAAATLRVSVPAGQDDTAEGAEEEQASGPAERLPLLFPVRVLAPQVVLEHTEVSWDGGGWTQGPAELALEIDTGGIYVSGATLRDARLQVAAGEDSARQRVELPEIWLPFELAVDQLLLLQPGWEFAGARGQLAQLAFSGRWQGTQLELPHLQVVHPAWGEAGLEGQLEFSGQWPLAADLRYRPAPDLPWQPDELGVLSLRASGDLADLRLGLSSDGSRQLDLRAVLDTLDPALPFSVEGSARWEGPLALSDLGPLPPQAAEVTLQSPLALRASGSLDAQSLWASVTADGLGYASLNTTLDASYRDGSLVVHRLAMEEAEAGSALFASGSVTPGETTTASLQLHTPGLALPALTEYLFGRVAGKLDLEAEVADSRWALDLRALALEGEVNNLPATARGKLLLDSERYVAGGDLRFDVNGARGYLQGRRQERGQERGQGPAQGEGARLSLEVADLGRWRRHSRGSLTARATLVGRAPDLQFEAQLDDAGWEDWELASATTEGRLSLAAPGQFRARVVASELQREQLSLRQLTLALEGAGDRRSARLASRGDFEGELQVAASREQGTWRGQLQPTTLATPAGRWTLAEAAGFTWRPDSLAVADHCWRSGHGRLCLREAALGETGQVQLALDAGLGLLTPLLAEGVSLEGTLAASLRADWGGGRNLQADGELTVADGVLTQQLAEGETATWRWDVLEATARTTDAGMVLDAQLRREDRTVVTAGATLPPERDQPLSGRVRVNDLQLGALRPFVPTLARLEGTLAGELDLAGSAVEPEARGRLQWRDGAVALYSSPTELTAIDLSLDVRGDTLAIRGGGTMGGGPVDLQGEVLARPDWSLQLALRGKSNRLVYPPSVEAVVSPDLKVSAGPELVQLRGSVRVEAGEVRQAELPEGGVDLSRDVVQVDYTGKVIRESQPFDASMDVRVVIADVFRVVGNGLDARVGGDLQLQQQPGRPLQLFGNLNVIGGEFRAYGQHLAIKQGRVSFAGVPENPELDLRAEREIPLEQVTAGVRVTGTLEVPQLEVYTDPTLSQPQALSYLIRGRGLDAGAGGDGTALALSLGTGLVNRSAVVEGLNRLPGLSNVEFGAETVENDTAATVSGYLGERIYLSYGVGLYEPVNVLTARLYLQTRLWLEVVSRLESSVDLYYSFDID